ncbi:hypothetical protein DFP72DRAFT_850381 [Ephemerocybe angulata]|uniref:Secreted protein n=1 Tax=Ephemerocybe angulata TaxID=980116 RepID=A0A8H6M4G6_9AGAR|nr:hypothetical protein DFP72DRAFT_850381 [Tulosesus angulatus]
MTIAMLIAAVFVAFRPSAKIQGVGGAHRGCRDAAIRVEDGDDGREERFLLLSRQTNKNSFPRPTEPCHEVQTSPPPTLSLLDNPPRQVRRYDARADQPPNSRTPLGQPPSCFNIKTDGSVNYLASAYTTSPPIGVSPCIGWNYIETRLASPHHSCTEPPLIGSFSLRTVAARGITTSSEDEAQGATTIANDESNPPGRVRGKPLLFWTPGF